MDKYNAIVEYHKTAKARLDEVEAVQSKIIDASVDNAKKVIDEEFDKFVSGMEDQVREWTDQDWADFLKAARYDSDVSEQMVMVVATAYCNTHSDVDEELMSKQLKTALAMTVAKVLNGIIDKMSE